MRVRYEIQEPPSSSKATKDSKSSDPTKLGVFTAENLVDRIVLELAGNGASPGKVANGVVQSLRKDLSRQMYFAVLPTSSRLKIDLPIATVQMNSLPFIAWTDRIQSDWLDNAGVDEVWMVFSALRDPQEFTRYAAGFAESVAETLEGDGFWARAWRLFHLDPRSYFKFAGRDGVTISALYSLLCHDLEIYFPRSLKAAMAEVLKYNGLGEIPKPTGELQIK